MAHCVVNNCVGMAHSYSSSKAKRVLKLRDVEVKTKTVQQALAPLIEQVCGNGGGSGISQHVHCRSVD